MLLNPNVPGSQFLGFLCLPGIGNIPLHGFFQIIKNQAFRFRWLQNIVNRNEIFCIFLNGFSVSDCL